MFIPFPTKPTYSNKILYIIKYNVFIKYKVFLNSRRILNEKVVISKICFYTYFLLTWKTTNCLLKKVNFQRQSEIFFFINLKMKLSTYFNWLTLHIFINLNLCGLLIFYMWKAQHSSCIIYLRSVIYRLQPVAGTAEC